MKILAFLVAFLFCIAFVLMFIGSRADNFSIKKMCSQLSSAFSIIALLLCAYGGMSVTLSSVASASEGKFKAVTNNEVRYFNKCKKENGHIFVLQIQMERRLWMIFGKMREQNE